MQNSRATPKGLGKTGASLSRLNPPNLLAGLIIFFSATQLGFHFWPLSSLVYGIRIDYLSPTIYFLDILIILYLFVQKQQPMTALAKSPLMTISLPIIMTNILYSHNPLATLAWSFHFLLYVLFATALGSDLKGRAQPADSKAGRSDPKGVIVVALTCSLLFQLLLALAQVILSHSIGGLLYYVGERSVAVGQPAVALGSFMRTVVLRAYGTFGHPNVLAGWSVVVLLILLLRGSSSQARPPWFPTTLTIFLILLTQSRAAALSLFGIIIPFYLLKNLKTRMAYFVLLLASSIYLLNSGVLTRAADLSLSERATLQGVSLSVVRAFPIFGSGAQASISTYPSVSPKNRLLQPDHNSFTLFLSWFGLFGVLAILSALRSQFENLRISDLKFLLPLLPLLLFDHYLLTSPQGLFIFLFYLGATTISAPDQIKKH